MIWFFVIYLSMCVCLFAQSNIVCNLLNMQMAEIIKEDFWPNPLKYFNNVGLSPWILFFYAVLYCF